MEGGKEQNYWPGFVDALSNVVLTLVFVLVIFVFALVMASSKVAEHVEKRIRSEMSENAKGAKGLSSQEGESQDTMSQISIENNITDTRKTGSVVIDNSGSRVVLTYPLGVSDADEKSTATLASELERRMKDVPNHKVIVKSIIGIEPYSAAKRFAYYRAINVRNALIKMGEDPANISLSIVNPPHPENGRVEIVFEKK